MIYRGPGFLAVVDSALSPPPRTPLSLRQLGRRHIGRLRKRDLLTGGGRGWRRSQIIRRRESLVVYKSYTLCCIQHSFICLPSDSTVPKDAGIESSAQIYRPSFPENKPKTLVFSHTKRAFSACFRENWVYNFGHRTVATFALARSHHSYLISSNSRSKR
jgi:hypothetical protein